MGQAPDDGSPWNDRDRELSLSLTLHEDGLCRCGQPAHEAHDPDSEIEYEAMDALCRACAVLDDARSGATQAKGVHWYVIPHYPEPVPID